MTTLLFSSFHNASWAKVDTAHDKSSTPNKKICADVLMILNSPFLCNGKFREHFSYCRIAKRTQRATFPRKIKKPSHPFLSATRLSFLYVDYFARASLPPIPLEHSANQLRIIRQYNNQGFKTRGFPSHPHGWFGFVGIFNSSRLRILVKQRRQVRFHSLSSGWNRLCGPAFWLVCPVRDNL